MTTTEQITSLAALKRYLRPGMTFRCENYLHPNVSGTRTVRRAQTNALSFEMPDGQIGWTEYPPVARLRFEGMSVTFLDDDEARTPAFTYYFGEEESR